MKAASSTLSLVSGPCVHFHDGLDVIIPDDKITIVERDGCTAVARNDLNLIARSERMVRILRSQDGHVPH